MGQKNLKGQLKKHKYVGLSGPTRLGLLQKRQGFWA